MNRTEDHPPSLPPFLPRSIPSSLRPSLRTAGRIAGPGRARQPASPCRAGIPAAGGSTAGELHGPTAGPPRAFWGDAIGAAGAGRRRCRRRGRGATAAGERKGSVPASGGKGGLDRRRRPRGPPGGAGPGGADLAGLGRPRQGLVLGPKPEPPSPPQTRPCRRGRPRLAEPSVEAPPPPPPRLPKAGGGSDRRGRPLRDPDRAPGEPDQAGADRLPGPRGKMSKRRNWGKKKENMAGNLSRIP